MDANYIVRTLGLSHNGVDASESQYCNRYIFSVVRFPLGLQMRQVDMKTDGLV